MVDDYEHLDGYRSELAAALLRIETLEDELARFRADPAYERVDIAEEALTRARARRARWQKLLPRVCIASFVAMGAFALTDPSLPGIVHVLAYGICGLGMATALVTIVWMLVLAAQGERPKRFVELERQVRIAKGDVGKRVRVELGDAGPARRRERSEAGPDETAARELVDAMPRAHASRS
jgi:hypothetical protein